MKFQRRSFLKKIASTATLCAASGQFKSFASLATSQSALDELNFIATGNFYQKTKSYQNLHGLVRVDCGNFIGENPDSKQDQETLEQMAKLDYHVIGLGINELKAGVSYLKSILNKQMPLVCSNPNFNDPELSALLSPYKIITVNGRRIGVIGFVIHSENEKATYLNQLSKKLSESCDDVFCTLTIVPDLNLENFIKQTQNISLFITNRETIENSRVQIRRNATDQQVMVKEIAKTPTKATIKSNICSNPFEDGQFAFQYS